MERLTPAGRVLADEPSDPEAGHEPVPRQRAQTEDDARSGDPGRRDGEQPDAKPPVDPTHECGHICELVWKSRCQPHALAA